MASNDDRQALQRRFGALSSTDRRAIVRAVNRGRAVEVRKHAPLAVHIANRQMRFWKWSWIIGPAVGLLQIGQLGLAAALINALLASALLGAMSAFFYLRAQRSAQANLALMGGKRPGPGFDAPERTKRRWWGGRDTRAAAGSSPSSTASSRSSEGHLPGRPRGDAGSGGRRGSSGDGGDGGTSGQTRSDDGGRPDLPSERRPYQPRGKKRRGR